MDAGLSVDPALLAAALVLVLGVVSAGLADRLRVPGLLLFIGVGVLVGPEGLDWFEASPSLAQSVGVAALVVILFEGGLTTPVAALRPVAGPAFVLATVGTVVTAGGVALAASILLDLPTESALLLGAVVASTDAAAVFSVIRQTPLRSRLSSLLEGESGLNDPMAVLLTIGLLETWRAETSAPDWIVFALLQLIGGAVIGGGAGWVAAFMLGRAPSSVSPLLPIFALGVAGVTYGSAAFFGASGFLAVFICGVVLDHRAPVGRRPIRVFHDGLSAVAQIVLFVVLGLLLNISTVWDVAFEAIVITIALTLVARPLAVVVSLIWFRFTGRELVLVAWAGLRGAVPIVLATFLLTAGHPDGGLVFDVVFFVVILSTLVQGLTVPPLAARLGLVEAEVHGDGRAELIPSDNPFYEIVEVQLPPGSAACSRTLADRPMPEGTRVAVVVRQGNSFVPDGTTVLEPDDLLVITAPRSTRIVRQLEIWANGDLPDE
jgi:cell volume regulation protein A